MGNGVDDSVLEAWSFKFLSLHYSPNVDFISTRGSGSDLRHRPSNGLPSGGRSRAEMRRLSMDDAQE